MLSRFCRGAAKIAAPQTEHLASTSKTGKLMLGTFSLMGGFSAAGLGMAKRLTTHAEAASSASGTSGSKFTLYQYQVCPFCNKAQTFLEYSGVPHKRVEVNPLSKKEMKFSEYRMVPFMVVEDEKGQKTQVNGSDEIVDYVSKNVVKSSQMDSEDTKMWRDWVNNRLVKLLPPNIYRTPGEALQAFDYIASNSNFSLYERLSAKYAGAVAMYIIARKSLTKYNIKDARVELAEEMNKWASEGVAAGKDFHGGSKPDKVDLAVYGVIRSIEGNYETWKDMQKAVGPAFWTWYGKVKSKMQEPKLMQ